MSRTSTDEIVKGRLINGFDYGKQAWVVDGKYVRCGHPESMDCGCYGRVHAGEETLGNPHAIVSPECNDAKTVDLGFNTAGQHGYQCSKCKAARWY